MFLVKGDEKGVVLGLATQAFYAERKEGSVSSVNAESCFMRYVYRSQERISVMINDVSVVFASFNCPGADVLRDVIFGPFSNAFKIFMFLEQVDDVLLFPLEVVFVIEREAMF